MATYKIVYYPPVLNAGMRGVAFIEADTQSMATYTFRQQYQGQYSTIDKVEKVFD